jgi:large subunit ribosomal protein L15
MSILNNLKFPKGSRKKTKRLGRGPGSGLGKTSGKGHKGQKSRSGAHIPASFEGGQMPLQRRIPKFGFKNKFKVEYQVLNLGTIQKHFDSGELKNGNLNPDMLFKGGMISKKTAPVKILGDGDFKHKVELTAHAFSKSAKEKIEKSGGKAIVI